MKKLLYISLLLVVVGCADNGLDTTAPDYSDGVYVAADFADNARTKAPYVPYEDGDIEADAPTFDNPLKADVWASSTSNVFMNTGHTGSEEGEYIVAKHTTATFQNRGPQLLSDLIYAKTGQSLYFVGLAPQGEWESTVDGTVASAEINGCQDLLFAPQVVGKYAESNLTEWPTLRFYHLLTWLRFEFVAESEGVSDTWGKLTSISLISNNKVSVDLTKEFSTSDFGATVSLTGDDVQLPLYNTGADTPFPGAEGYKIPYLAAEEKAYILCAPVEAEGTAGTPEYTLIVTTENRTVEVPIDLKEAADKYFSGWTRAKQFTIKLTFKVGDRITAAASIKDWENGGVIEGIVDEN